MKMLTEFNKKRAIKQYVEKLPGWLKTNYGGSGQSGYTDAQVKTAVEKLNLNSEHVSFAILIFCGEEVLLGAGETSETILAMSQFLSDVGSSGSIAHGGGSGDGSFLEGGFMGGGSGGGD